MYSLNEKGFIYLTGRIGSFVSFLISTLQRKTIIFYETEDEALLYREEIEFFSQKIPYFFPLYTERIFSKEDEAQRVRFLYHLVIDKDFIGLFPYSAIARELPEEKTILANIKKVTFGDTLFHEDLTGYLEQTGYELASLVREEGQYAKRGSIIDVFSPTYDSPLRIEFLGDQVLSVRFFDPITQRSLKEVESCYLMPIATHMGGKATIVDYMINPVVLVHNGFQYSLQVMDPPATENLKEKLKEKFKGNLNIDISGIKGNEEGTIIQASSNEDLRHFFESHRTEIFKNLTGKMKEEWSGYRYVYLCAHSPHQAERLQNIFENYGVTLPILTKISFPQKTHEWGIVVGPLRRGFRTDTIVVLTEEDIVGPKKRVVKKRWNGFDEFLNSFKDLAVGEWVVHIDHGIGIYQGITELEIGGYKKDFLLIEYQDGDRLYVPVENLHLVQKFIGSERYKPKIDRLGSSLWKHTKKRAKKHIEDIARELLTIYAERELAEGYQYSPEDELFREMESSFEYEETDDQLKAIADVLNDLEGPKPMDRLICGDVGFGKTEVALRASFKVVMDSKQVVLLVPTTVLAQQHYKTFSERLQGYPVNVEMLSRFRTKDKQKKVIEGLKKGQIDIVVGTHRLLQKDVAFRDLGLLIIDEEHRFGVRHKEKFKTMKTNVDVLTMTATPIPRTLHMATTGIKDLSIINTPPLDRLAVKTSVVKFNDGLIRQAVLKEIQRQGQVFFVHNFVHNIGVIYEHLSHLIPEARIAIAHGQMKEKQLEKIMLDFIGKQYDILLCTNIIESGLDISNVNTIFINNAHRMGLAELYQLRGRVGRSTRQGYAYLLVPVNEVLTKDALIRLKIIEEMIELGSGFHIANYDLEIRGAGNLLGREQSGTINLIGFELYCHMLEETIKEIKNTKEQEKEEEVIPEIAIPVDAYIPDAYIGDGTQKLLTYKRLSRIRDDKELKEMEEELKDRFGNIPEPLQNLLDIISLKCFLQRIKVKKLEYSDHHIIFHVTRHTPLSMEKIVQRAQKDHTRLKLLPNGKIVVYTEKKSKELLSLTRNILMEAIIL
ncbi:MAG TPA: transcription-repair coupling factor [Deltaproteobacteria bacterium]|nr:transcription-repair coupling factor [Deltaproteobacteria bacterium]